MNITNDNRIWIDPEHTNTHTHSLTHKLKLSFLMLLIDYNRRPVISARVSSTRSPQPVHTLCSQISNVEE